MPQTPDETSNETSNEAPNQSTPSGGRSSLVSLMEKRERILIVWNSLAPQARFADLTVAQFQALTAPSKEARDAVRVSKAQVAVLARAKVAQAQALKTLLKRVVNAVRLDLNQGENSPLYRAMGYVPASERRSRWSTKPAGPQESPVRERTLRTLTLWERYQKILLAWEKAEGVALPGVTLEELRAAGAAYAASQSDRLAENSQRSLLIQSRYHSDQATREIIRQVVAGVIASRQYGINSALYRAMGYIPNDERKPRSRGTSAASSSAPASPAVPVAA